MNPRAAIRLNADTVLRPPCPNERNSTSSSAWNSPRGNKRRLSASSGVEGGVYGAGTTWVVQPALEVAWPPPSRAAPAPSLPGRGGRLPAIMPNHGEVRGKPSEWRRCDFRFQLAPLPPNWSQRRQTLYQLTDGNASMAQARIVVRRGVVVKPGASTPTGEVFFAEVLECIVPLGVVACHP